MELLHQLGIDWKLLIAQIINFLVLLFVLYRFLYKPIILVLDNRQKTIQQGIQKAEASNRMYNEAEQQKQALLLDAQKKSNDIIEQAKEEAQKERAKILDYTKKESDAIVAKAKDAITAERETMIREAGDQMHELLFDAVEKVSAIKLDTKNDKKIISDALSNTLS